MVAILLSQNATTYVHIFSNMVLIGNKQAGGGGDWGIRESKAAESHRLARLTRLTSSFYTLSKLIKLVGKVNLNDTFTLDIDLSNLDIQNCLLFREKFLMTLINLNNHHASPSHINCP